MLILEQWREMPVIKPETIRNKVLRFNRRLKTMAQVAALNFDDLNPILDKETSYKDVIDAGRAGGRADKGSVSARALMCEAVKAHGKDDPLVRAALMIAYAASRCELPLDRVAGMFPKGADRPEDVKKAFNTAKTYYNRALKDAGLVSEGTGAGNANAAQEGSESASEQVTEPATPAKKSPEELGEYFLGQAVAMLTTGERSVGTDHPLYKAAKKFEQEVINITKAH